LGQRLPLLHRDPHKGGAPPGLRPGRPRRAAGRGTPSSRLGRPRAGTPCLRGGDLRASGRVGRAAPSPLLRTGDRRAGLARLGDRAPQHLRNRAGASLVSAISEAIAEGIIGGRLWVYSNYHCNLTCSYCLTESAPRVARRQLPVERIPEIAEEGRRTGFDAFGVTGGEPFLVAGLAPALAGATAELPTLVLSNGTLFTSSLLAQLEPLAGLRFAVQVSLDSADPDLNDALRGPRNFARVVESI